MKNKMSNETKNLIDSYKQLAYLTGRIEFVMAYRYMEITNTPLLLCENNIEEEITL